jgi:hypothetical protein
MNWAIIKEACLINVGIDCTKCILDRFCLSFSISFLVSDYIDGENVEEERYQLIIIGAKRISIVSRCWECSYEIKGECYVIIIETLKYAWLRENYFHLDCIGDKIGNLPLFLLEGRLSDHKRMCNSRPWYWCWCPDIGLNWIYDKKVIERYSPYSDKLL